jgi:YbbR domain-containing protein
LDARKIFEKSIENWPAKVLSVILAIILFTFHQISTLEEDSFSAPLRIESNGQLVPSNSYEDSVRITLRSDERNINSIDREDIEVYVDLMKIDVPGTYRVPVLVRKTGTAVGIDPLEIRVNPSEIEINLDYNSSKSVSVTPNFRGSLDSGYEMISYSLEPTQVEIEGPRSIIDSVTSLSTEYIELTGRRSNFVTTSRITASDPLMKFQGSGLVEVHGFVQELIMIRNFNNLPITITGLNNRFTASLNIDEGSVRVEGSQNALADYILWGTVLSLDCSNIETTGTVEIPVTVSVPPQFSLIRYEPMSVSVTIEAYAESSSQEPNDEEINSSEDDSGESNADETISENGETL